jgi:ABC-type multidrug transport system fused ATPase/permease subunit
MRPFLRDYLYVLGDAKRRVPWIVALLLFSAALDVFSLGLIPPLIGAITDSTGLLRDSALGRLILRDRSSVDATALAIVATLVIAAFSAKGVVAYVVQLSITRFAEQRRRELMTRLLQSYLAQPYEAHLSRHSTALATTVLNHTAIYSGGVLGASLRLCADGAMLVAIAAYLAWTDATAVALMVLLLGVIGFVYTLAVRTRMHRVGAEIATVGDTIVRAVVEAVGPVREVKVLGIAPRLVAQLDLHAGRLADWNARSIAIHTVPRHLVETAMVTFIVLLGVFAALRGAPDDAFIPTVGVFGVAAMRLMPTFTAIMSGLNMLRQSSHVLAKLSADLQAADAAPAALAAPPPPRAGAPFGTVRFEDVTYTYPNAARPAVTGLSFAIRAGEAVGIIGRTGSGKSTLADLLLGLLVPQSGRITVDGRDIREDVAGWQAQLAYIPQSIFLIDDTVQRNVALGIPDDEVDRERLHAAIQASQLAEVVAALPEGLQAVIGERGVRLSGGQRQRVALARALYHDRKLIVMDEATSALDTETEREVTRAIGALHGSTTLVIIAHRLSTLEGCQQILELDAGRVHARGLR